MKLHTSLRAPNPRRVDMFIAEKGITGIERSIVDLNKGEHRTAEFALRNPMARVPVLELDDGRYLAESRAICTYLEGLHPEPNLMGVTAEERAFIEMADRQVEMYLLATIANFVRHTHPGLAVAREPAVPRLRRRAGRAHARGGTQRSMHNSRPGRGSPAIASRSRTSPRSAASSSPGWSSSSRPTPAWRTWRPGGIASPRGPALSSEAAPAADRARRPARAWRRTWRPAATA